MEARAANVGFVGGALADEGGNAAEKPAAARLAGGPMSR